MQVTRKLPATRRTQQGVSLLEVLIAVLIMGIGLLGIAAMQTTALRNNQSSLERSQAVIQSYAILDAMRANRAAALAGEYNTGGLICAPPVGTSHAATDIGAWMNSMETTMGNPLGDTTTCGDIACDAVTNICTVNVTWDDSRAVDADGAGLAAREVVTVARL
jgi:type IV pilus assembly protein PilV